MGRGGGDRTGYDVLPLVPPPPPHPTGGGPSLQALMHILQPGHQDLATVQPLLMLPYIGPGGTGAGGDGTLMLLAPGGGGGGGGAAGGGPGGGSGAAASYQLPPLLSVSEAVQPVKEAAVVSALRVVTAALRMDAAFLATLARAHGHDRWEMQGCGRICVNNWCAGGRAVVQ